MSTRFQWLRFGSWTLLATLVASLGTACGNSESSDGSGGGSTGGSASGSGGKGSGGKGSGGSSSGGRASGGGPGTTGGATGIGGLGGAFSFGGEFSGIGGFSFGTGGWMNGDACPDSEPDSGDACSAPTAGSGGGPGLNDYVCNYGGTFCVCNPQGNIWTCLALGG